MSRWASLESMTSSSTSSVKRSRMRPVVGESALVLAALVRELGQRGADGQTARVVNDERGGHGANDGAGVVLCELACIRIRLAGHVRHRGRSSAALLTVAGARPAATVACRRRIVRS